MSLILSDSPVYIKFIVLDVGIFSLGLIITIGIIKRKMHDLSLLCGLAALSLIFAAVISLVYFDIHIKNIDGYVGKDSVSVDSVSVDSVIEAVALKNTFSEIYASANDILIVKIDGEKVSVKAKLYTEYPCDFNVNERFTMRVNFVPMEEDIYGFAERNYNISKGFLLSANSADYSDLIDYSENKTFYIQVFFNQVNNFCDKILRNTFADDKYSFLSALLLGNGDKLDAKFKRDLKYTGLSHIVVVSGTHFTVLVGLFTYALGFLKTNKKLIYITALVFTLFYMGLTGFSPSVIRSAVMYIIYSSSFLFKRRRDTVTSLFVSVTAICIFEPNAVFDIGLMLSFTATLGIVTLGRYLSDHIIMLMPKNLPANICGKILGALAISLSASVFTLPVIYANFGYISVISPVVTLLSTIPITIILALAPFAVILTNVPFLLISVKVAINLFSSLFFAILSFFSSYSGLCVSLNYYFIKYVFVFFIVGIIIISLIRIKIKNVLLYSLPFIVAVSSFYVYLHIYNQSELNIARIVYITNKKSEGFIVKHGGSAMICDISDGSYAISKIADYLLHSRYSVLEIDTYMITHYHNRHVATLYKLSQNTFIGDLIMPVPTSDGERNVYDKLIAIAAEESFNVILYERGDENKIELYGAIQIGIMEKTMMSRSTHPLIALDFTYGEQKLLYIGGSVYESSGVGFIHERYGKSDAVIFGQHGPIIKKTAYPTISGKLQYIIYAAENVADTVDKTNIAGVNYKIHNEGDYFTEIIFIGGTK